jgi:hypothetical protein
MTKTTIEAIPTRRYSLEHSLALWRKKTAAGKRWYVVGPKQAPPSRGWKKTMRDAIEAHRGRRAR